MGIGMGDMGFSKNTQKAKRHREEKQKTAGLSQDHGILWCWVMAVGYWNADYITQMIPRAPAGGVTGRRYHFWGFPNTAKRS